MFSFSLDLDSVCLIYLLSYKFMLFNFQVSLFHSFYFKRFISCFIFFWDSIIIFDRVLTAPPQQSDLFAGLTPHQSRAILFYLNPRPALANYRHGTTPGGLGSTLPNSGCSTVPFGSYPEVESLLSLIDEVDALPPDGG